MESGSTDEMLMLRYKEGDVAAFDALFSKHNGGVYRYFVRQRQAAKHAEDLAQDVWMRVIKAAAGYEVTAKFNTWLYRIAHNRLIDHLRGLGSSREDLFDDPPEEVEVIPIPEFRWPDRINERRQLAEQLVQALSELPPDQAEAFLLHEEGEMTLEEIASVTGVGRETVKSRLRYALSKLRRALGELR